MRQRAGGEDSRTLLTRRSGDDLAGDFRPVSAAVPADEHASRTATPGEAGTGMGALTLVCIVLGFELQLTSLGLQRLHADLQILLLLLLRVLKLDEPLWGERWAWRQRGSRVWAECTGQIAEHRYRFI